MGCANERLPSNASGDDDDDDDELLMLGAQEILRICFTPTVGWLTYRHCRGRTTTVSLLVRGLRSVRSGNGGALPTLALVVQYFAPQAVCPA